jgi:hypothetical protein
VENLATIIIVLILIDIGLGLLTFGITAAVAIRGFREINRTQRVLGALIVQESEKVQALLHG